MEVRGMGGDIEHPVFDIVDVGGAGVGVWIVDEVEAGGGGESGGGGEKKEKKDKK